MKKLIFVSGLLLCSFFSAIAQNEPKTLQGGILNGKAMSLPKPEFPESAKAAGLQGIVRIDVTIDEEGNVTSAEPSEGVVEEFLPGSTGERVMMVANSADPILIESARSAALSAKFAPTKLSGQPVKVKGTLVYRFFLNEKETAAIGEVLNTRAVVFPAPAYPPAARAVRAQGAVNVQIVVDEGGMVISATAVSGHPLLRAAAVSAARKAQFAPEVKDGAAAKFSGVLTFNFVLPDGKEDR